MSNDSPPSFEPINFVNLVSADNSKITSVSLYSGRAEITRVYKFAVKTGQNQVNITGLPNILDQQSLRVEGRGAATIHGVTVSSTPSTPVTSTSPSLSALLLRKKRIRNAIARCKKSLTSLESYLGTLNVERVDVSQIGDLVQTYDSEGEKLDNKLMDLEGQLGLVDEEISSERKKLAGPSKPDKLGLQAAIGVFADTEGDVEIVLIYAVHAASWNAGYDIRVNMQTKEKPVTMIYKAAIAQNTGEAWDDVPLTLETASPSFGVGVPQLRPWSLSIYKPSPSPTYEPAAMSSAPPPLIIIPQQHSPRSTIGSLGSPEEDAPSSRSHSPRLMTRLELGVTSKGNVSATFRVPGIISIPSDGEAHNVTIVQLQLDASMSWVAIPKKDPRTHLKAKIKNASEFTLIPGDASVYVDGSFISRSPVPAVSPQESFDCPLGLDPSIRITYHPRLKKVSQTGFYQKTSRHVYSQRLTIFNTKATAIDQLRVVDQIPVSEDSQVNVKLVGPALVLPSSTGPSNPKIPAPVTVSDGVVAQWEGADEPGFDAAALGKDGKFNWVCSVPAQGKINLLLEWEVTAPVKATVQGL